MLQINANNMITSPTDLARLQKYGMKGFTARVAHSDTKDSKSISDVVSNESHTSESSDCTALYEEPECGTFSYGTCSASLQAVPKNPLATKVCDNTAEFRKCAIGRRSIAIMNCRDVYRDFGFKTIEKMEALTKHYLDLSAPIHPVNPAMKTEYSKFDVFTAMAAHAKLPMAYIKRAPRIIQECVPQGEDKFDE